MKEKKKQQPKTLALILDFSPPTHAYNGEILGRKLCEWVAFACKSLHKKIVVYDGKSNYLQVAKENVDNKYDYTLILPSTIPLITSNTINNIIEYAVVKDVLCCKLPVGYVVNNKYLLSNNDWQIDNLFTQFHEDFYIVESKKQYIQAEDILQDRINTFHLENGVDIKKSKSVYIEPCVDIGKGVVIFGGNTLRGNTIIESGVILKENNVINNSRVGGNACLACSQVDNATIGENVYVSAFCSINNSIVGKEVLINPNCTINNTTILPHSKIDANTVLGDNNDSDSRVR